MHTSDIDSCLARISYIIYFSCSTRFFFWNFLIMILVGDIHNHMDQKTTITSSDFLPARFRSVFCSKHPGTPHSSAWQPLCQETCHTGNLCDKMNGAHANGRNAFFHFLLATSRHAEALACPDGSLALAIFFSCCVLFFFASLFPFGFCLLHFDPSLGSLVSLLLWSFDSGGGVEVFCQAWLESSSETRVTSTRALPGVTSMFVSRDAFGSFGSSSSMVVFFSMYTSSCHQVPRAKP